MQGLYEAGDASVVGIVALAGALPSPPAGIAAADAPRAVPLERWDVDDVQRASPVALEARFGAFVRDADLFDAAAFNITRCRPMAPVCRCAVVLLWLVPLFEPIVSLAKSATSLSRLRANSLLVLFACTCMVTVYMHACMHACRP